MLPDPDWKADIQREAHKLGPVGAPTMIMTTNVVICLVGCSERSPTEERLRIETQRRSQPRSEIITVLLKILKSQKAPQKESVLLDQCLQGLRRRRSYVKCRQDYYRRSLEEGFYSEEVTE